MTAALLPPAGADDVLYLLDLSGWARAIAAVAKPETSVEGHRVEVTGGVIGRLVKLIGALDPAYLAVCTDDPTVPPGRRALWAPYKAEREEKPPSYLKQHATILELLRLHRIPVFGGGGFEADDYIAAMAARGVALGLRVVVVSRDHDLWQTIGPGVVVLEWDEDPKKRRVVGPDDVRAACHGIGPELLGDMLALTGDKDEAPGVDLVGPKNAAELLRRFGSLDKVLRHADWLTPGSKMRANLLAQGARARLSRQLVALRDDAPLDFDPAELCMGWDAADADRIIARYLELGLQRYASVEAYAKRPLPAAVLARAIDEAVAAARPPATWPTTTLPGDKSCP